MTDRERVIAGLQDAIDVIERWVPMFEQKNTPAVLDYAAELLRGPEPKVLTPDEAGDIAQGGEVWAEIKDDNVLYPAIRHGSEFSSWCGVYFPLEEVTDSDDYLKEYRFWSARPTDKQRKAVKWQ